MTHGKLFSFDQLQEVWRQVMQHYIRLTEIHAILLYSNMQEIPFG